MKLLTKTLCAFLTTVASISALSTNAVAGEGGAAGRAAFTIDGTTGNVTRVAVSAAVGKQDAFGGAFQDSFLQENTAFVQVSAGTVILVAL